MSGDDRNRRAELAKIHIARKELGLDEDTYRDILERVTGARSASGLDAWARGLVLAELRRLGWSGRPADRVRPALDRKAQLAKVRAMLRAAGRPDAYGDAMARHMFRVDRMEWCEPGQLQRLILALVYDAKRHGRRT